VGNLPSELQRNLRRNLQRNLRPDVRSKLRLPPAILHQLYLRAKLLWHLRMVPARPDLRLVLP